jgi:pimeloyl-ACP methyl ester carboxylesterase
MSTNPIPELKSIELPGGVITYREAGKGDPLIFLHGINIHSAIWMNQIKYFSDRYHVIAWDAPSYGGSAPREARIEVYAAALKEMLDALGLDRVILVGHSMGGIISGSFATHHPDQVVALVLSCTHTGAAKPKGQPLADRYQARIDERAKVDPMEYGRFTAAKMTTDSISAELTEQIAAIVAETSAEHFLRNARMNQEADNREGLTRLKAPTLIINGGSDRLGPSEGQKTLLATMPEAEKVTFSELGHSPYLEDPEAYNQALERFFNTLD